MTERTLATAPNVAANRLTLLRTLFSAHDGSEVSAALEHVTVDDVRWLVSQGLASYVYLKLRDRPLGARLPQEAQAALRMAYSADALREALQHQEAAATVLSALREAGVETVLMKGMALASTVYPNARSRPKGDLDLWIQPEQRLEAIAALERAGYQRKDKETRPVAWRLLYGGEQQMVSDRPGSGLVELQWPAIRHEWLRQTARVEHEEIWRRRQPITVEGQPTHVMALEDMLIHVCVHHAINHQFGGPWLRAFLDVHLMAQKAIDWEAVVERARHWHLATVTWTILELAVALLNTPVPADALSVLAPSPLRRRAIRWLRLEEGTLEMWPSGLQHRRLVIQLLLVDHLQGALRLLWGALFPDAEWLRTRYGTQSAGALWRARLIHPLRVLFTSKA